MKAFVPILYMIGLYSAYLSGSLHLRTQPAKVVDKPEETPKAAPYATLLVTFAIAIPSTLQFFFPAILSLFRRDYAQFLVGDWWRLGTSLFVQDGNLSGTVFNLVSLLLVGTVAERLGGSRNWILIFFGGGILSQLFGFLWQPIGAGNSVANFSLAASIAVLSFTLSRSRAVRIAAILALGAGGILFFLKDIHGAAILLGAILALILIRLDLHKLKT